ncbi:MAG: hypothetical protein IPK00_03985 [Deltaproteobacteria bacterium]|nr:hypothetical protein [Deltaproteobacteria bacterium]
MRDGEIEVDAARRIEVAAEDVDPCVARRGLAGGDPERVVAAKRAAEHGQP